MSYTTTGELLRSRLAAQYRVHDISDPACAIRRRYRGIPVEHKYLVLEHGNGPQTSTETLEEASAWLERNAGVGAFKLVHLPRFGQSRWEIGLLDSYHGLKVRAVSVSA